MKSGVIVVIMWVALLAAALGIVRTYGTRTFPQADELWALYDAGPGIHAQWLWTTWAEHRIPLAKLIWKTVLQFTDYDFRAGDFLIVAALALMALGLVWTAGKVRGRVRVSDAFFPLALLNFGQAQVFLWWWQINHVLAPVLGGLVLALVVLHGNQMQLRHSALLGAALIVFVLCGPGGLPYVLALAAWLLAWTVTVWPSYSQLQRQRLALVLFAVFAAFALTGFYFVDYKPYFPVNDPPTISSWAPSPGLLGSGVAYLQILGLSLGTVTKPYAVPCGLAVLGFGIVTASVLIQALRQRPAERFRVLGLLAMLCAQAAIVAVIAWSRAGMGLDYIYQGHYLTIVAPALCVFYFAWEIAGGRFAPFVEFSMAIVLVALLPASYIQARQFGNALQQQAAAFERDVRAGVPASVLAEHHFASDVVPRADKIMRILTAHKANGMGIFKEIRDEPHYRTEVLPVTAAIPDGIVFRGGVASGNNADGSLTFALGKPQHVYAVRLHYAYLKTANLWGTMRIYWRNSVTEEFGDRNPRAAARMYESIVSGPDQPTWALIDGKIHIDAKVRSERVLTVWIDKTIDQFRIYPDSGPCEFRLPSVEILTTLSGNSD